MTAPAHHRSEAASLALLTAADSTDLAATGPSALTATYTFPPHRVRQSISKEVYEAAALDGAGLWQAFWGITFPLLRPAHFFVAVVSFIGCLQMFDQAFVMGGGDGSPANSLSTVVLYLYRAALVKFDFGYAAAVGIILFVAIMAITLVQRRLFGQAPAW